MLFSSNNDFKIFTDDEFQENIGNITKSLEDCRVSGTFQSFDSNSIYYEYFLCEDAAASVVLVHGLSEFTKKYYETAFYLLQNGFNVFLYDQRCHGFSQRLTDDPDLIHVNSFDDYVTDLEQFIDKIVLKTSALPIYIYSHSMGGAVASLYLQKHPEQIKKAILSAPLFQPYVGKTPFAIAKLGTLCKMAICGKNSNFNTAKKFNPENAVKKSNDKSIKRFVHNLNLRVEEPMYRTTPLTSGWIYNSLNILPTMRKRKTPQSITTPLLLISAENDRVVVTKWHRKFAQKCPACRLEILLDSGHSILMEGQQTITDYINLCLEFLKS